MARIKVEAKIDFAALPWEDAAPGLRVKRRERGGKVMRLVEFSHGYDEWDWCEAGHTGYLLEGSLTLAFDDGELHFGAGEALRIEDGPENRHRTIMAPGERALLFLTEDL